jgi:hypothetical protein
MVVEPQLASDLTLAINDKHTLPVNMPTISPFGIDGNPERLR